MQFTKKAGYNNYMGDLFGPKGEYFSVLLQKDKLDLSYTFDELGGLVGIDARTTETALVYN